MCPLNSCTLQVPGFLSDFKIIGWNNFGTIGNSPCQKPQPIFNHDFDVKVFLERGVSTASKRCPDFFDALASKQRPYTLVT